MLTADEIKALTPEQKIELKKLLDEQEEVVVSIEQPKVDETIIVVQTEEQPEVVEEKTKEVVETVEEKVEEHVMPNFEEKFSAFDKRVQEAEERFKAELEKRDKTIAKLEASNEELQRTRPTGGVQPKVSNPIVDERKATEDKMLDQFKKGYVNKQI
jgi:multidrug efflux pump subunit AcrB